MSFTRHFALFCVAPVLVSIAQGQISLGFAQHYPSGPDGRVIRAHDVDGDGDLDLVTNNDHTVVVLPNLGNGTFGPRVLYPAGIHEVWGLALGDVNGDGTKDAVFASRDCCGNGIVELGVLAGGGGGFLPGSSQTVPSLNSVYSVELADVNGDGTPDAVLAGNHQIAVYLNNGSGAFVAGQVFSSPSVRPLCLVDVDGDTDIDIVAGREGNTEIRVHLNTGFGTFNTGLTYLATSTGTFGLRDLACGDIDGDGDTDVVVGLYDNVVGVLDNNGNGTFATVVEIPSQPDSSQVALGDLDGDGDLDLVTVASLASRVYVFENDGTGTFTQTGFRAVGANPQDACVSDLNGDGLPDIAVRNAQSLDTSVLLNTSGPAVGVTPYPGTGEDLSLLTGINGATPSTGPGNFVKSANPGEAFVLFLTSPLGGFVASPFIVAAEPFQPGSPPATFPGFPSVHMSPPGMVFLFNSTVGPFANLLGTAGFTFTTAVPVTLSGQSVMFQAVALNGTAANGVFAATDAHEIQIQ